MESQLYVPSPDADGLAVRCTVSRAAAITGRSRRTVQRWIQQEQICDPAALTLLQMVLFGRLPPPWDGWRLLHGTLIAPWGDSFTTSDLRAAHVNAQLVRALQARVAILEKRLAAHQAQRPTERLRRVALAMLARRE